MSTDENLILPAVKPARPPHCRRFSAHALEEAAGVVCESVEAKGIRAFATGALRRARGLLANLAAPQPAQTTDVEQSMQDRAEIAPHPWRARSRARRDAEKALFLNEQAPLFELTGNGWRVSFQRRVGSGIGANRGALPCHKLRGDDRSACVLVPLLPGEALWVGWTVEPRLRVEGELATGQRVCIHPVASAGGTLFSADAFHTDAGPRPIDAQSVSPAFLPEQQLEPQLRFVVTDACGRDVLRLGVVLVTPQLYELVSGRAAPSPTTAEDAYKGWRLP
jgi:hypothetical protein